MLKPIRYIPPPPPPPPSEGKSKKTGWYVAAVAIACCLILAVVIFSGAIGNFVNKEANPITNEPTNTPNPTLNPTQTPFATAIPTVEVTLHESYFRIDNWYPDQIVRYVAVKNDTGESYEANYALAAANPAPQTGNFVMSLPGFGQYSFTVYTASGLTVWWDSIYLNVDNSANPARINVADSLRFSSIDNVGCSGASGGNGTIPI